VHFKLDNFKPIKSAEIKVNDLTLIFGDNNTGKTYLAYALYGLLSKWGNIALGIEFLDEEQRQSFLGSKQIKINKRDLNKEEILNSFALAYAETMASEVFLSQSELSPKIQLSNIDFVKNKKIKRQIGQDDWLYLTINEEFIEIQIDSKYEIDFGIVNHLILKEIFNIPDIFISVSERLGISLFQKDLDENTANIMERLKKNKDLDPLQILFDHASRYALPVKDNIGFMRAIERHQKSKSELTIDLSTHIENMFDAKLKHDGAEIVFFNNKRKDNKMDIPLHLASASVRALSNLYFFLKHKAKKGDLIIIDEPESHLSLVKQRLLAKLIADCINNGLKILLTTHSDTLVLEINNLIMLSNEFDDKDSFMKTHKYQQAHIINPEKVSAYIAKDGGVSECTIDQYGIEVESMDKAIDDLNTIRDGLEARIND
jgi:ABC-type transport system involved in cytochrome c biogenesis ATPase subunit